jgi:hypothetical protein
MSVETYTARRSYQASEFRRRSSPEPRHTGSTLKGRTDIADLLFAKGANVDARDKPGATRFTRRRGRAIE